MTHLKWRLFIIISRESKWGTLKSAGNPRCTVPAEIHSICTDWPRPGSAAGVQVSPTSDTCQSVTILMKRRHSAVADPHWYRVAYSCSHTELAICFLATISFAWKRSSCILVSCTLDSTKIPKIPPRFLAHRAEISAWLWNIVSWRPVSSTEDNFRPTKGSLWSFLKCTTSEAACGSWLHHPCWWRKKRGEKERGRRRARVRGLCRCC